MKFHKKNDGEYQLDVQGCDCPHPQVYTKNALEIMAGGDVIELLFDNPTSSESIAAMLEYTDNEIIDRHEESGTYIWKIRKG